MMMTMMNSSNSNNSSVATARYDRYPAYRDSGVAWLGEAPAHWEVKRLKFSIDSNPLPSELGHLPGNTEVSFVPMEAIGEYGGVDVSLTKTLVDVKAGYTYFREGDVVIAKITPCFENGKGALAEGLTNGIAFGTTELHVLRANQELSKEFLFYVSIGHAFRNLGEAEMYGAGGQKRVPESFIENFRQPLPPLPEQRAIAAFLDRETTRIDALIAKKERLIELLQEKRAAVITQAVTKGLDPSVPMKDSGVEWLGEVPAHWAGLPLKRWVSEKITDGPHETPEFTSDGVPFISAESISNGRIDFEKKRGYITSDLHQQYRKKIAPTLDDILICKSGATTGKFAMVEVEFEFSVWSPLALIRVLRQRALPRFVARVLESEYVQDQIKKTWSAGTQPNISMQDLERLWLVCPPVSEQVEILTFLASRLGRFDELVEGVRKAIVALVELRTALISAAVTGKIDVREG